MVLKIKKQLDKVLFTILVISIGIIKVNAECSYIEKAKLNDIASLVRTNYEVIEEKVEEEILHPEEDRYVTYERIKSSFKITLYNLNKEIYIIEENDLNNEQKYIYHEDTDKGVYSFVTDDIENIIRYTYKIYSNLEGCSGDVLKTYNFVKPKKNMYAQYGICQGLEDIPYCKTYLTEELTISEHELARRVSEYLNQGKKEKEEDKNNFLKENYIYIIIGIGVVGATGIAIYIVRKRSAL